jgi:internalin A
MRDRLHRSRSVNHRDHRSTIPISRVTQNRPMSNAHLISILLILSVLSALLTPAAQALMPPLPKPAPWCNPDTPRSPATTKTIDRLLTAIGFQDCATADRLFKDITGLYPIETPIAQLGAGKLTIDLQDVTDLTPFVDAVPQLRHLEIRKSSVSDLSPLRRLTQLESLTISDSHIVNVRPIANLPHLTHLNLRGNQIRDISSLSGLKQLKSLDVVQNQIRDFRVLAELPNLFKLGLSGNPFDESTCLGKWSDACDRTYEGR